MEDTTIEQKEGSIFYPPGGILIWFIIMLEIFTFLGAVLTFLYYRGNALEEFATSQGFLNPIIGSINTIILITSGYFIAVSVEKIKENDSQKSAQFTLYALILGIAFLLVKSYEYYHKIELGLTFSYDTFFTCYWLMTGFHFVHVLFGVGLLAYMQSALKKGKYSSDNVSDIEASATYWHMCDLIWILIFPALYLI